MTRIWIAFGLVLVLGSLFCPAADLDAGLIAHYPFNQSAADASGNGFDAVVHNAVLATDRFGDEASAYRFNGGDSYLSFPDLGVMQSGQPWSVGLWFNAARATDKATLIDFHGDRKVIIELFEGQVRCAAKLGGVWSVLAAPIRLDRWYSVVYLYDPTAGSALYLNGALAGADPATGPTEMEESLAENRMGGYFRDTYFYSGIIDDVRIYGRAVSEEEVALLSAGGDGWEPEVDPLAEYLFSQSADDTSGNEFHAVSHGALPAPDRFGRAEQAYDFDGTGAYIAFPDLGCMDMGRSWSVCLWFLARVTADQGTLIDFHGDRKVTVNVFNGELRVAAKLDGVWRVLSEPVQAGRWYMVGYVYNDWAGSALYIDGQLRVFDPFVGNTEPEEDPAENRIGGYFRDTFFFDGTIDDIRVFARALPADEVAALFHEVVLLPPVADAGPDRTVPRHEPVLLDGSGSHDPDGRFPITYAWRIAAAPAGAEAVLADAASATPTFTADLPGEYTLEPVVTDADGLASEPDLATVAVTNTPPVADAGPDRMVYLVGQSVELDGSPSYDEESDPLDFNWTWVSRPAGSAAALTDPAAVRPAFVPDVYGEYVLALVVSDPWDASAPAIVRVSFDNLAPVADAGANQSVTQGEAVTLDGWDSSDPNGDPLAFAWSLTAAPVGSAAALESASSPVTRFTPDLPGAYEICLVVSDGWLESEAHCVSVVAVSYLDATAEAIQESVTVVNALDPAVFKNPNLANALTAKLNAALLLADQGNYAESLDKLRHDILGKTDGCAGQGAPDKNDWIQDCAAQEALYPLILEAIALLENLI